MISEKSNENTFNLIFTPKVSLETISPITLAFYGDALHTLIVRKYFLEKGIETSKNLHRLDGPLIESLKNKFKEKLSSDLLYEKMV